MLRSLEEALETSPLFFNFRKIKPSDIKGVCSNCLAREICRGGCRVRAYATYHDLLAPDPFCQKLYDNKLFPRYALIDPLRKSYYERGHF